MTSEPKIAFFADTFLEINGAAMTCRLLAEYAEAEQKPLTCYFADHENSVREAGSVTYRGLKRSKLSIPIDEGLAFDPLFMRYFRSLIDELESDPPDVIHVTGLNDVSILGTIAAYRLQVPLVASWHTNLHEFAASRIERSLRFLPGSVVSALSGAADKWILAGSIQYFRIPKLLLVPNRELADLLEKGTRRAVRLMLRGVDAEFFSPARRTVEDGKIRIGYTGRLRAEKNLGLLVDIQDELRSRGIEDFEFLIVGDGDMRAELESRLQNAHFTGYLKGEALAEAYANMDIFVFPSETDAFGNVVQEANASGVPAIVSSKGGPKFLVEPERNGFVAETTAEYADHVGRLIADPEMLNTMRQGSREIAISRSWRSVFESVWDGYRESIEIAIARKQAAQGVESAEKSTQRTDPAAEQA